MQHTDFFARIRAIKTEEYKELQAAVELHGGIYEWDLRNPEHPVIAVNLNGIIPAPADVRIYKVYIRKGMLKLCGVEKEYGEEARFQPEEVFAGHLSTIIDYLPPINRTDSIVSTTVHTSNKKKYGHKIFISDGSNHSDHHLDNRYCRKYFPQDVQKQGTERHSRPIPKTPLLE